MSRGILDTGLATPAVVTGAVARYNYQALIWDDPEHQDGWTPDAEFVTKDGSDRVASLASRKTGGTALVQSSAPSKPLWLASDINGKPSLQFERSASTNPDRFELYTWTQIGTGDFSVVLVMQSDDATNNIAPIGNGNAARKTGLTQNANQLLWRMDNSPNEANATISTFTSSGAYQLVVAGFTRSTGTARIAINGGAVTTGINAAAAPDRNTISIGSPSASGSTSGWNGRLALIDFWNCDLLSAGKATKYGYVKQFVRDRFGLTVA